MGSLDTSAFNWHIQNSLQDNGGSYRVYFKAKQISPSSLTHLKAPRHTLYSVFHASELGGIIHLPNEKEWWEF